MTFAKGQPSAASGTSGIKVAARGERVMTLLKTGDDVADIGLDHGLVAFDRAIGDEGLADFGAGLLGDLAKDFRICGFLGEDHGDSFGAEFFDGLGELGRGDLAIGAEALNEGGFEAISFAEISEGGVGRDEVPLATRDGGDLSFDPAVELAKAGQGGLGIGGEGGFSGGVGFGEFLLNDADSALHVADVVPPMWVDSSDGMVRAAGIDLIFFRDLLRRDSSADFDDGLMGLEAVFEILEVGLEVFARSEDEAGLGHFTNVGGLGLELVDVHAGFDDFDDRDTFSADLFHGFSDEGMERCHVQSVGGQGEKEGEEEFHRCN